MVFMIIFTHIRWFKCLLALQVMNLFGNAASRLSARRSVLLARMHLVFERTRSEALRNLKQFSRRQMTT